MADKVAHYVRGIFKSYRVFLPQVIYGWIRDNVVRTAVDVIVLNEHGEILLGKRKIHPKIWFTFGGGMIPGERPGETASRILEHDIGFKISPERFLFLEPVSWVFSKRQEPPQDHGCHDLSLFHFVVINDKEVRSIVFRLGEYEKLKWSNPTEISGRGFHPATVAMIHKALVLLLHP